MRVMIRKASGEFEEFNPAKVRTAVIRSGARPDIADHIVEEVSKQVRGGMSTNEIYRITFGLLRREKHSLASRYDLKRAIMRLGPAGFPFETYLGEILKEHGHSIKLRQKVRGRCVEHEVDILLDGDTLVECKYHNQEGIYTGLKPTLYTYARFLDIKEGFNDNGNIDLRGVWLATNTKFSSEAIQYAGCKGMNLLGWRYPPGNSLENMIESKGLYPITILRSIDSLCKSCFSNAEMMLLKDLIRFDPTEIESKTGVPSHKLERIIQEAKDILNH